MGKYSQSSSDESTDFFYPTQEDGKKKKKSDDNSPGYFCPIPEEEDPTSPSIIRPFANHRNVRGSLFSDVFSFLLAMTAPEFFIFSQQAKI